MSLPARLLAGVLLAPALAGSLVLTAGPASARSCAEPSADLADGSDLVFSGVVVDRRTSGNDPVTTVRVERAYEGEVTRKVDVVSASSTPGYAVDAALDDEVVVFATLEGDEVVSDLCRVVVGPGQPYDRVLRDLGEGTAPAEGYTQAERSGLTYDQWQTGRLVTGVLGLGVMGVVAWRALRARRGRRASG